MKTFLIIDGHAMIHRAFHALPQNLTTKSGEPTGAVYGFFLMLQRVVSDFRPTHIAVAFDTPKPTFRKKLFSGYQAKRPPMDDLLKQQIPKIKTILDAGGVKRIEKPGFEADDVIGTLVSKFKSEFDRVLILTGDRDLVQLTDKNVSLIAPQQGVTHFHLFTPDVVKEKYGVSPVHIPDYKALVGDPSDNYHTAKGIGPKTASTLLKQFNTIEELLSNLNSIENIKWKEILKTHKKNIMLYKKLATVVTDLRFPYKESYFLFNGYNEHMKTELHSLELFSIAAKYFSIPSTGKVIKEKNSNIDSSQQMNFLDMK